MRVKIVVCFAIVLVLLSTNVASANIFGLTFPVIHPASASDSGKVLEAISGLAELTKGDIASKSVNASNMQEALQFPLTAIPGPVALLSAMAPPVSSDKAVKEKINKTLVGMNLTYYSFAGKPMNYTITADSIKSIDRFAYGGKLAWKVRVGEGLAWDLIMDETGSKILKTDQLFQT